MIYTALTVKAMQIAYRAHEGQVDQMGVPYIFHPFHLAEQMTDEASVCAALLHDVAEDTSVTLEQLRQDFPPEVTDALALLTHSEGVDYLDYVRAIAENPIARKVKLADLAHNGDEARMAMVSRDEEWRQRHEAKYRRAKEILLEGVIE